MSRWHEVNQHHFLPPLYSVLCAARILPNDAWERQPVCTPSEAVPEVVYKIQFLKPLGQVKCFLIYGSLRNPTFYYQLSVRNLAPKYVENSGIKLYIKSLIENSLRTQN